MGYSLRLVNRHLMGSVDVVVSILVCGQPLYIGETGEKKVGFIAFNKFIENSIFVLTHVTSFKH